MYFTADTFAFLRQLQKNNNREWFAANKDRYESLRDPILQFIGEVGPGLQKISKAIVADPRPNGGSLFRIYRDTRFSKDKSPYKTHLGAHFFHDSAKKGVSVPGFYLHIAPDESFIAAGIWHPEPAALAQVRDAIAAGSSEWKALRKSKLPIEGASLKRPPKGYRPDHPFIEDLKRTDFVTSVRVSEKEMCGKDFASSFIAHCRAMAPLTKFVSRAMGLSW